MPGSLRSLILRYGCALVCIALAIWTRLLLDPVLGNQFPYATLFFAVLVTAWYGGFGPGLAAVVLGALGSAYFLIPPRGSFAIHGWDQFGGLALYAGGSLGIALLGGMMHAALRRVEASAQAAHRQAALIDQTHDAVLTWDWNGPITSWNRGAERLYGFPRTEALGRVSHDLLRTQTMEGVPGFIDVLEREGLWEGELEHSTRDGAKVIVETRMVLIRDAQGTHVLEINRDISHRRRAEIALREAMDELETRVQDRTAELAQANESLCVTEERFRLVVERVKDYAIFMLDPGGHVVNWNQGAERIKGYNAGEIVGQHFSRFYPPEDLDAGKPEEELKRAIADGQHQDEGWRLRKDGSRFWAHVLITAIRDDKGQLMGFSKVTRDMTKPRREAAALQESQARMGGIIDSAMDAIISVNEEQHIVLFNAAAEKMFRCPAEKAMGQSIGMFIPGRFREQHRRHVEGFASAGVTSRSMRSLAALSGLRADGEEFPIEASISQLEVAGQKVYSVILRDITERERAEEALRKSETQLKTIVESLDEGLVVSDLNGQVVHFNRAALDLFGFASLEECRLRLPKFADTLELGGMDGTIWPVDQWPLARILRGETLRDLEVRTRRIQGDCWERVYSYGGTLVKDPAGQPLMAVVTITDVTERKRAEESLRNSEAQLHTVVENLNEGVGVADLDGKFLHFNRAALDLFGFANLEECLLHQPEFADMFEFYGMDGAILPQDQWPLARVRRGGTLRDMEVRVRGVQVECERVLSYSGAIVKGAGGQPLMMLITISDITERRRAAEVIRQFNTELEQRVVERTAQLEAANKELEAFSYSVSHDLRAPLRAVDGFSKALLEDCGPVLPEEGQRYLKMIREGAQRMGALIDDLLTFAQLSRQSLNKRTVDAGNLVRDILEELNIQREGRQIEVRIGDLPPCQGDRALLKQVWINLLSNALKYTRRREPAVVEVGCASEQGETVYFVRDNGTGFDMRYADKLFGVFQRLHRAEEFEGTGVGLAIAQRVIHRHGGRIWADAAVDRGATFYFTLEGRITV